MMKVVDTALEPRMADYSEEEQYIFLEALQFMLRQTFVVETKPSAEGVNAEVHVQVPSDMTPQEVLVAVEQAVRCAHVLTEAQICRLREDPPPIRH